MDEYRYLLHAAGFDDIMFIDVTEACLNGFRMHMERYFQLKNIGGDINDDMLKTIKDYFHLDNPPVGRCFFVLCRKPE